MSDDSINKVPLSAVQEKSTSKSEETDEIDFVDEDSNFVVKGNNESESIEIVFTHPENSIDTSIPQLRDELRSLKNKPIEDVTHQVDNKTGRIAIESIDISESSDSRNLREITIQGKFLPWPKHYTSNKPTLYELLDSEILSFLKFDEKQFNLDLSLKSGIFTLRNVQTGDALLKVSSAGSFGFSNSETGIIDILRILNSNLNLSIENSGIVSVLAALSSETYSELENSGIVSEKVSVSESDFIGTLDADEIFSLYLSYISSADLSLNSNGIFSRATSLDGKSTSTIDFGGYGTKYGSLYGRTEPYLYIEKILSSDTKYSLSNSAILDLEKLLLRNLIFKNTTQGDISNLVSAISSLVISTEILGETSQKVSFIGNENLKGSLQVRGYGARYGDSYGDDLPFNPYLYIEKILSQQQKYKLASSANLDLEKLFLSNLDFNSFITADILRLVSVKTSSNYEFNSVGKTSRKVSSKGSKQLNGSIVGSVDILNPYGYGYGNDYG